ncbi:hypothetical protein AB0G04_28865 [Actinoplanes sp. NPDC023801]|uniref:hypothetical protein n=1 Tax=Actinoplanes sp. NPDC023801 TaxID=3154595 RepID=UPI0033FC88F0
MISAIFGVGAGIGTAAVAAVITSNSTLQGLPADAAFTDGFWVCAGVAVLAVVAALLLPSAHQRHAQAMAAGVTDVPPEPEEIHLHRARV